jgi:2-polyprenyl-3-methyl-5-hydroxy-6-metoxy-1,4-benzoquinol methylase
LLPLTRRCENSLREPKAQFAMSQQHYGNSSSAAVTYFDVDLPYKNMLIVHKILHNLKNKITWETSMTLSTHPYSAKLRSLIDVLLIPLPTSQGTHLDPVQLPPPDEKNWDERQRHYWQSQSMNLFRQCVIIDKKDLRSSIVEDLSKFYKLSPEECVRRCLHWEELSVEEWKAADRTTPDGLRDFYNSIQSWSFDLMWYAYLQATGHAFPAAVAAVEYAAEKAVGRQHLDFGSGIGITSQLFARRGFVTTLADVSRPLLDFARWRLDRHGDRARVIDLNIERLPVAAYDCITALDTLAHVPDFDNAAADLHRALKPKGLLFANFDVRDQSTDGSVNGSAWHLYSNAIDLDCRLQAAGFVKVRRLGLSPTCYMRVERTSVRHRARIARNALAAPVRQSVAVARRVRLPTPTRAVKLVYRLATRRKIVTNTTVTKS